MTKDAKEFLKRYLEEEGANTEEKKTNVAPTSADSDGTPNRETPKEEKETNAPPASNNSNGNVKNTTGEAESKQEEVPKESAESNGEKNNQNTESSSFEGDIQDICSEIANSFGKQTINGTDLVITPASYSNPVDNGDGTHTYSVQFSIMKPKDSLGTKVGKALDAIGLNLSNFSPYGNTNKTSNQSYTKSVL